ncbi:MAG: cob(I)yrinic acid a,c-diamide adenosyltransferase [Bacteroidales bacterium]|nr:cob(I)yrinic acid a,c-diamide adenosyltransferase [Bacteroidales bacterium]
MTEWKIYTKGGDKGQTSLLGGRRVPKHHLKIEAYGTADELNAFIGLLRDQEIDPHYRDILLEIQDRVFTAESILACDEGCTPEHLPTMLEEDVLMLEREIDAMNESLPELTHFILPGGHPAVSYAHVCRCVCRRAERIITQLAEQEKVDELIIQYFNRLSDYFFVLARKVGYDLGIADIEWHAKRR